MDFKESSKTESICEFFGEIKLNNPEKRIVIILDNFSSHRANATLEFAIKHGIELVFLPPYSPSFYYVEAPQDL